MLLPLLALALAAASPAGTVPASGGALRVAADPPALLLGRDSGAELRVAAPPEVEELTLTASAGRIEGVHRLPQGGFAARYRPPADRVPQVALVAAVARTARGLADGWLAIPLSGQGDAKVRGQPGATISLRIGDAVFGPTVAGDDGLAVIPVIVPPGVREAHHGFRPIDLHVPETPLLHAVVDRTTLKADRVEVVRVLAYVVAPHGAARRGDVPVFEPSRGAVAAVPREPGAYEATWTLPPGPAGEERLVVRLPGSVASRAVLRIEAAAGAPATVAVAFDREALVAGEAEAVRVTARALDGAGNPVSAPLELAADAGTVDGVRVGETGRTEALLHVAPAFGRRHEVTVTARLAATGISGARALPLRPGTPAALRIEPAAALLRADGESGGRVSVVAVDRFENPVRVEAPVAEARAGRVEGVAPDGDGAWAIAYRTPVLGARAEERLRVSAAGLTGEAGWVLLPPRARVSLLAGAGVATDVRGRFAAGGLRVAAEVPARWPGALGSLPEGTSASWRLELDGAGWTAEHLAPAAGAPDPRVAQDVSSRAAFLLGGATLQRDFARGPQLWAALTAGVMLASAEPDGGSRETGGAPAARVGLGAGWPLRLGTPFLEASFLAAGSSPVGAFATVGLAAGVKLDLGGASWRRSSSSTTSR
jgi:hypothetical protein